MPYNGINSNSENIAPKMDLEKEEKDKFWNAEYNLTLGKLWEIESGLPCKYFLLHSLKYIAINNAGTKFWLKTNF